MDQETPANTLVGVEDLPWEKVGLESCSVIATESVWGSIVGGQEGMGGVDDTPGSPGVGDHGHVNIIHAGGKWRERGSYSPLPFLLLLAGSISSSLNSPDVVSVPLPEPFYLTASPGVTSSSPSGW